ncbi:PI-PLC X domain-containing protein 1 isoform X2 [Vanacampus margaritifer]
MAKMTKTRMDSWMSLVPTALWDTPLYRLAIPGSHNAITYCLDKNKKSPIDSTQPDMLQVADKYASAIIRPFIYNWAKTQEESVTLQLDCGIRYLDMRIGAKPGDSSGNLYFYHGFFTTETVETVLVEIDKWLEAHPKEVVILSLSHYLEMNNQHHAQLLDTIRKVFKSKLCPRMGEPTFRKLWSSGHQVIVTHEYESIVRKNQDIWHHITYWWANKFEPKELIANIESRKKQGRPGGFIVTGINLTATPKHIVKNVYRSLKDVVKSTNPELLGWVKRQVPGGHPGAVNIVAADFVTESNFAAIVVTLNAKLKLRSD